MSHNLEHDLDSRDDGHLVFTLGGELYAVDLFQIREVIKMLPIKFIPNMVNHFRGIVNLRGQIVSIIDLRMKFGLTSESKPSGYILIIETKGCTLGAIVDDLVCVQHFQTSEIEKNTALESRVPTHFFKGIAHLDKDLVSIVDLGNCLDSEDMRVIKAA